MLSAALTFLSALPAFCALDRIVAVAGFQNPYYLLHSLHNAAVVYLTLPDVLTSFTDFHGLAAYEPNYTAAALVAALHLYHIALYRQKFRLDDWLHHALMIFVALPLGVLLPSSVMLGYSLFFSTGLPGGIDYALLFGVRNGWIHPLTEKRVNTILNVWVRSPGCVSHAALAAAMTLSSGATPLQKMLGLVPAALMGWNGQYFMQQVVRDLAIRGIQATEHEP